MLDMHGKCRFDIRKLVLFFLHRRFLARRVNPPPGHLQNMKKKLDKIH